MTNTISTFPIRYKWEVSILLDGCVCNFVSFYCHLYYNENFKTTYIVTLKSMVVEMFFSSFYAVQIKCITK